MGNNEHVVYPKTVISYVFNKRGLNSDSLVNFSAMGISKASIEARRRFHHRAKLIIGIINRRVSESVCLENPLRNVTKRKSKVSMESKKLDAINDSLINLSVTGNRNTQIFVRNVMSNAYMLSYLISIFESKPESYESSSDTSFVDVASRLLKFRQRHNISRMNTSQTLCEGKKRI